ncbi:ATP12 family chaperone protein [Chthonobacter albigriseus]|uniref:ATP12 family chaperone protein n=1 Tax=Chthonobacter albigriseus TaxID=1683161 RepID=UPI0015EF5B8D|nr:ATP12 family protein [Chthonobacter albigriseus]
MRDIFEDIATPGAEQDPIRRARELSRGELPKRFYKSAAVAPEAGGFAILLDGRPVRTPARNPLVVASERAAAAIAAEWEGQGTHIDPSVMPLTRLANSAIDGVAADMDAVAADAAKFAGSDLLLYRADGPDRLVARQTATWDPVVAWAENRLGVRFRLVEGVMPVDQDPAVIPAVRALMPDEPLALAALHSITTLMGSVLLAVAALEGRITGDQAWNAAHLDEDWTIELWGDDEEASERRAYRRKEFDAAALVLGIA